MTCIPVTCRFFDSATGEWGYEVICYRDEHKDLVCPCDHELFRNPPEQWWLDRKAKMAANPFCGVPSCGGETLAIHRVKLYEADDTTREIDVCGPHGQLLAGYYPDNIKVVNTYPAHTEGIDMTDAERVAEAFHTLYEALAPEHGYETREASAKPWKDVPDQNKYLMIHVCQRLITDGVISVPPVIGEYAAKGQKVVQGDDGRAVVVGEEDKEEGMGIIWPT